MERGAPDNLGFVAEEIEENDNTDAYVVTSKVEEYHQDKDGDEDNKPSTDTRQIDANTFEGLCDGIASAMALVHQAMLDLLEFKDEMLRHTLPPTVLTRLALITGQVFRSISDLGVPVGELVRLVRIYSSPWKEQTIALRKLHESLVSKHRQLDIAIQRLQLLDEQSKQMARERRIMNWEKLFLNVTNAKSHGRQWKFLIETIKQKAKLGLEHVLAYTKGLEESSKSLQEEEAYTEDKDEVDKGQGDACESDVDNELEGPDSVMSEETKDDQIEVAPVAAVQNEQKAIVQTGYVASVHTRHVTSVQTGHAATKIQFHGSTERSATIKPPTQDVQTWTQEPEFDRFLFVRIFCPEGFKQSNLKCSLSYSGNIFKTPILDSPDDKTVIDKTQDTTKGRPSERPSERSQAAQNILDRSDSDALHSKPGSHSSKQKRFSELQIQLPDEVKDGCLVSGKKYFSEPESLRFAVHKGRFEEIIAMATVHFKDILKMSLETVYLPPPHGDDDVPDTSSRRNSPSFDGDSLCDSEDIPVLEDDPLNNLTTMSPHEGLIKNHEPQLFALYPLESVISDRAQVPCGKVPVLMYWGMRVRPQHFNRQCGTHGVFNMIDIDLASTASEELHKETVEKALSAITYTPEVEEETVLKTEYDTMVEQHKQEMIKLQEEYEKQIEELIGNMQAMQAGLPVTFHQSRPVSKTTVNSEVSDVSPVTRQQSENNMSRIKSDLSGSATSRRRPVPPRTQKPTKNFRVGHRLPHWGEHLPQDFLERLSQWEEDSKQHKQELNEKTLKDIKDNIERKLAGQYKLSKCEEQMYDALRDVSLPALFMPFKTGSVYNPRAYQYFQPTGATGVRLSQPPSVFQLPPLPKSKLSVLNLFELSKNFHIQGPTWLMEQYIESLESLQGDFQPTLLPNQDSSNVTTSDKISFNKNLVRPEFDMTDVQNW